MSPRSGGWRGPGGVSAGNLRVGGAKYFFSERNSHQDAMVTTSITDRKTSLCELFPAIWCRAVPEINSKQSNCQEVSEHGFVHGYCESAKPN